MGVDLQEKASDRQTDQDLIDAVNRRDLEAFEILYHRHRDYVVNLAYRFTGDRDLALDVLQETFLYFLRKFPGFELTCQLRSFLYPVVRHLAITARRKAGRCQSNGTDPDQFEAPWPPHPEGGTAAVEELKRALASLPAPHREVLLLRFLDGLSLNEIAEAMELPLGTVKSRLHYALENLRTDPRTKPFFEP